MNRIIVIILAFLCYQLKSQTIIINEVSNGATGNREYVEFVVASNTVTYNCSNTTPPCIDIRGWIFDDNSGLHGGTTGTGVAAGAIRFSQNSLWSCVPLGTIILIYNGADKNPAIPADDLTMADGNCKIVAPVGNTSLFESNLTTPGAVACSYPSTGWTPGGDWNTTLLANGGDCARIVNLAGCEVFSVCYGTANTNNLIYFLGAGGQTVFYFNDGDPAIQTNWSSGTASVTPGNQTPGTANNAANASYISKFNNNCSPITPLTISTPTVVNAGCTCNGSASVSSSGSIGGYTYAWYNSSNNPIGQTAPTATALCAGVYKVVSTSHIGCKDSVNVTITATSSAPTVTVTPSIVNICPGQTVTVTATSSSTSTVNYSWSNGPLTNTVSLNAAGIYTVTATNNCGSATATVNVTLSSVPTLSIVSSALSICASGQTATLSLIGSSGTYTWSTGAVNTPTATINSPGVYSATVSTPGCGNAVANISLGTAPLPVVSIVGPASGTVCAGNSVVLTAYSNANNYVWSTGATTQTISLSTPTIAVTSTNACGSTQRTYTLNILTAPTASVSQSSIVLCTGQTATVQASSNNATVNYTWSHGPTTSLVTLSNSGVYTVTVSNGCGSATKTVTVSSNASPSVSITATQTLLCGGQAATLTLAGSPGTYSWSTGAPTQSISVSNGGVYTATVTTACGVRSTSVNISALPTPTVSVMPGTVFLCPGTTPTLTATSNAGNYIWSTGPTTSVITVSTPGVKTVSVSNACGTAIASATVSSANFPPLTLVSSADTICPNAMATLTVSGGVSLTVGGPVLYSWSSSVNTGSVATTTGGIVTVRNTNACGINTATIMVHVNPVTASVTATPISGVRPLLVDFVNNSTNASSYQWNFGNGNTASTETVSAQNYNATGNYTVYLYAQSGVCIDVDSVVITVLDPDPGFIIPNVFTPNNDNVNDVFRVKALNIVEFNCVIFDRWGLQLFTWDDISKGWDGKINGKDASDGTYFYIINAKDISSKEIKEQGSFSLFR